MDEIKSIQDLTAILRRRKWALILPALIIFVIAVVVVQTLPPTYRSAATILIEEQEIPREYVMSMITGYAEQRLQTITQSIMSSTRLIEIINRFNLYPDLRNKRAIEESIAKMRNDIKFETISAEGRAGRGKATIAFTVSYEGKDPNKVFQVTNVLASLYLEENMRIREEKTTGTSKFIEEEMKNIQDSLAKQDAKISAYKKSHLNTTPEMNQMNIQELERLERNAEQLEIQLRTLKERESFIKTQMASIPSTLPAPDKVQLADPEKKRLNELRHRLISLKTLYTDEYPDVRKTQAEIAELEKRLNLPVGGAIDDESDNPAPGTPSTGNPAYINLNSQLSGTQSEIDSMRKQVEAFEKRKSEFRRRIEAAPGVEEGYRVLLGERNNLQIKYDDLMKKHMETKIASGMEKGQLGERFTLIDPARMPEKPVSPNRPAILFIGLFLGLGSGVGFASLREFSDKAVRSAEGLTRATGFPVLASIPEITTPQDKVRKRTRRRIWIFATILLVVLGVVLFHFFIMDLDVFWARLTRKLTL